MGYFINLMWLMLVTISLVGCGPKKGKLRWSEQWDKLPSILRDPAHHRVPDRFKSPIILLSGMRGYRFDQTSGVIYLDLPISDIASPPLKGKIQNVKWVASPEECFGKAFRIGEDTVRFLLIINRSAIRYFVASGKDLILVNDAGNTVATVPPQVSAYDLDIQKEALILIEAWQMRCVSAEAKILAASEIERLHRDAKNGKITHEMAVQLQKILASLLASSDELCTGQSTRK
jgi:hypothetical protein